MLWLATFKSGDLFNSYWEFDLNTNAWLGKPNLEDRDL